MTRPSSPNPYILGIDLGSASLGWALIEVADGGPSGLMDAGVRIFDPGVDGNIDQGQDESKNKKRREARLHRRQLRRKAARRRELFATLQSVGLMPATSAEFTNDRSAARHAILNHLDQEIWSKWKDRMLADPRVAAAEHVAPYYLRARALEERLELHELGRALYHLAQRRGYKSNRKAERKKDDDEGVVLQGIADLGREMQEENAPTVGEYFSSLDPNKKKIRRRWSERDMFLSEFEQIWKAQTKYHLALLTGELKQKIHTLLFFQRPLQDNEELVGPCELEPKQKRAAWATLAAQRFRLLQRLNDMEVEEATGFVRMLAKEERTLLLEKLETEGDQTFAALRKLIGIKAKEARFNFERGGEKNCRGNRTASGMRSIFGERWETFSSGDRETIVEDWRKAEDAEALLSLGKNRWALDEEQATLWTKEPPEPGYCGFSLVALKKLLPHMEEGMRLNAAIRAEYPSQFSGGDIYDFLPPLGDVRNPAINRSMSELRKLVNAIVRKQGKPTAVRIELARDLKKSKKDRKDIWQNNRSRQKERDNAAKKISAEVGRASRDDIEKFMLAIECGWVCPYTSKEINVHSLFVHPEFQVEHILPRGRFPDNSFQNKTLCHVSANNEKGNRTPYEAFHADEDRWAQIIARVKKFDNPTKLRRFQLTPEETAADKLLGEFTSRQLNDTRYSSKLAARFLSKLYGGRDEDGQRRVFASSGAVTATLRQVWQMNRLLSEDSKKNREDHRHHAVDAIVIGLTSESVIKQMAKAAESNGPIDPGKPYRPFKGMQQPWPNFVDSIRPWIEGMKVSHRPNHKLSGPLHEEGLYSRSYTYNGKESVNIRKPVHALTPPMLNNIVDPAVRKAVKEKLEEVGDISKLENDPPTLTAKDGRRIPIRKVRIRKTMKPTVIGKGMRERQVQPGNNHHMEIFVKVDDRGQEKRWEGVPVSLLESLERKRLNQPVVAKSYAGEAGWDFKFSLMGGDTIELSGKEDQIDRTGLWRVRKIASNEQFALVRINDARQIKDIQDEKQWWQPRPDALRKLNCRKVEIDLLGRIHYVDESRGKATGAGA